MPLKIKILITLVLVGFVPTFIVALISINAATHALTEERFDQLESLREVKRTSVNNYLTTMLNQVKVLAENQSVITAMKEFKVAFENISYDLDIADADQENLRSDLAEYYSKFFIPKLKSENPDTNHAANTLISPLSLNSLILQNKYIVSSPHGVGEKHLLNEIASSSYNDAHQRIHPFLRSYLEHFGFYDIFLIDAKTGNIVYSVYKEVDFATSLKDGPYAKSGLADVYRDALNATKQASIRDFQRYVPSYDAPAGFISAPLYDEQRKLIGVLAFQFPIDALNKIMTERAGLGETGETYLVGSDKLMRSDSFSDPLYHGVVASFKNPEKGLVSTKATDNVFKGQSGIELIKDIKGNSVLSAYAPLGFEGLNWAIIAEIAETEALAPAKQLMWLVFWVVMLSIVVIVMVGFVFSRNIMKPLGSEPKDLEHIADTIAKGDLSRRIEGQNASGVFKSMIQMSAELQKIVKHIYAVSDQQSAAAEELSAITKETGKTIDRQNQSTELVATAMNEMTSTVEEVAKSTQSASDDVKKTRVELNKNVTEVTLASKEMTDVSDSLEIAKNKIDSLKHSTDGIVAILVSITNIADQTNLLALNAAIEAARAGDQGRGFAVVADEVRSLAQNTQKSTEEISRMISILKSQSDEVSSAIDKSLGKSNSTSKATAGSVKTLMGILKSIESIDDMIFQIAGAAEEQTVVAEDVNRRIVEIRDMSVETQEASSQTKIASQELARLSIELQEMVTHFKLS